MMTKKNKKSRASTVQRQIRVSNIPYDATEDEIKEAFQAVGDVKAVEILKEDNKKNKHQAIITFKTQEMAKKAIETMNKKEFKGRKLFIKEEEGQSDLKKKSEDTTNYNTYGLSSSFLKMLNIELPIVNSVFVANFGVTTSESCLKDVFSLAGHVVDVEIYRDKEGNSRGYGIVEYNHPLEAVQAISMLHNQVYKDNPLAVRMERYNKKRIRRTRLPCGLKSIGMGLALDGGPLKDFRFLEEENTMMPVNSTTNLNPLASGNFGSFSQRNPVAQDIVGILDNASGRAGTYGANQIYTLSKNLTSMRLNASGVTPAIGLGQGIAFTNGSENSNSAMGLNITGNKLPQGSSSKAGVLGNIIQVGNLPLDYNSERLRQLCWTFGDVQVADMRSQGTGIVKFKDGIEAQRAADMLDQQSLDGWILIARVL